MTSGPLDGSSERNDQGEWYWIMGISAAKARGMRLHFRDFDVGDGQVWIHDGDAASGQSYGPYTGRGLFDDGDFWTEIIFKDTVYIEYRRADRAMGDPPRLRISEIYHLWSDLALPNAATNVSCFLDETCYAGNSWVGTFSSGVALLLFDDHACSGTLLNDRNSTNTPYLMTAGHCIADQTEARSMVAVFDFRSAVCNGMAGSYSSYPQVTGSTLLAQNVHSANGVVYFDQPDFAFVRLTSYPNAVWRSMGLNFAPGGSDRLTSISHPYMLPQRLATGSILDQSNPDFFTIRMYQGMVDSGSSGSGLVNDGDQQVGVQSNVPLKAADVSSCDIPNRDSAYTKAAAIYPAIKLWIEAPALAPIVSPGGVVSAASGLPVIAPGSWVSVYGQNLGPASGKLWTSADFVNNFLPTAVGGTRVTVNGHAAAVSYASASQVNFQAPDDGTVGLVPVIISTPAGTSNPVYVNLQPVAVALFTSPVGSSGGVYAAALHADGTLVLPPGSLANASPARGGEVISLWGTACGPSNPARSSGQLITAAPLANAALLGVAASRYPFRTLVSCHRDSANSTLRSHSACKAISR